MGVPAIRGFQSGFSFEQKANVKILEINGNDRHIGGMIIDGINTSSVFWNLYGWQLANSKHYPSDSPCHTAQGWVCGHI